MAMYTYSMQSSAIEKIKYACETRVLLVYFHTSPTGYRFEDVPPSVVEAWLGSESQGKFYNQNIREQYNVKRLSA